VTNATRVSVEEGYELWAPSYDSELNPLLALEKRQVEPLLPDLGGKRVLDVACGSGRWLERLLRGGARSGVGVDVSLAMLASARAKAGLRDRLVRADGLRLPFASGIADLAVCSFALAHLRELGPLARELARVARPQADLFVTDVHPRGYARGWQTAFSADGRTVAISTFPHPVEEVRESFETHGFRLLQLTEAPLGEPERPIFLQAGKAGAFKEASEVPAVLICHFRRKPSEESGERS
jgi:ubiquinone/menaquinone biosynthesis C-methylase UbiE